MATIQTTELLSLLSSALVPKYALSTTLSSLGQTTMRAVLSDRAYRSKGVLKSISISQHSRQPVNDFRMACARFAAELVIVGEKVLYVGARSLLAELRRYEAGVDIAGGMLTTALWHKGILVVPDYDSLFLENASDAERVGEYLLQHESSGGSVVVPLLHNPEYEGGRPTFGVIEPAVLSMLPLQTDARGRNV